MYTLFVTLCMQIIAAVYIVYKNVDLLDLTEPQLEFEII